MKRKLEQILADVLSGVRPERLPSEERAALEASPEGREALETAALAAALDAQRGSGLGPEAIERTRARLADITGRRAAQEEAESSAQNFWSLRRMRSALGGVPRTAWAVAAAALALFMVAPRFMPEERVGQLAFAAGELTLEEAGTPREIAAGPQTEVIRCESAVSAREGGAILVYDAGAAVYYGSDTRTKIAGVREFELERGSVWVEVERGGGEFLVRTAEAVIRVTGTAFEVARDDFGTRVSVARGSVEVASLSTGASLALKAGERTDVSIGARGLARSAGGADTPKWVAQLRGAAEAAAVGPLLPSITGGPQGGTSP